MNCAGGGAILSRRSRPRRSTSRACARWPNGSARRLAELEEVFQRALERLPEKYRTPLLLLRQQRMDYPEVAAVLRTNENALRVLVHRGRRMLKAEMEALP